MFKVVPDQLKISDGWVRCGHCAEVFDAQLNLQQAALGAASAASAMQPDPIDTGPAPAPWDDRGEAMAHATRSETMSEPVWTAEPEPVTDMASPPVTLEPQVEDQEQDSAPGGPGPVLATGLPITHVARPPAPEPPAVDVSFMREARRRAFWRRPLLRLALGTFGLALTGLLLLQMVLDRRDQLAASRPQLRVALEALCRLAACSIQPWRQIDALVIDGSSFNWLAPDVYRLALSVKNVAALEVAKPSIELTLTDVRDRALLRRVLTPGELGAAQASIQAGGEWAATATVQLAASGAAVAGYRVLAFYP
jgi:predicted Zn finger-like uncharacterized protein